jgi:hypothetical protein
LLLAHGDMVIIAADSAAHATATAREGHEADQTRDESDAH